MFRILLHALGRLMLTLVFGIPPVEKIRDEPCIVAANHNTHVDIMILFRVFALSRINKVKVVAAGDYFRRGVPGAVGRMLFDLILVERNARDPADALAPIEEALSQGYSVILFPEGTRGEPGVIQRFKSGIGQIALDRPDVPVYPVFLRDIEKTLPRGRFLLVPFNVRIQVMPPVYGRDFLLEGKSSGRKKFTSRLEELIRNAVEETPS